MRVLTLNDSFPFIANYTIKAQYVSGINEYLETAILLKQVPR